MECFRFLFVPSCDWSLYIKKNQEKSLLFVMVRKLETKLVIGFLKYNSAFLDDDDSLKEKKRFWTCLCHFLGEKGKEKWSDHQITSSSKSWTLLNIFGVLILRTFCWLLTQSELNHLRNSKRIIFHAEKATEKYQKINFVIRSLCIVDKRKKKGIFYEINRDLGNHKILRSITFA